jgi:glycosyltransferase involved in cell wall biosynthesis
MTTPLVSILINNYNYARFVDQAIASALNQTYPHTEVILVDDGSTDNSRQVIQQYNGRIVTHFKSNAGQGSTFNAGFALSRGDIICFLDADDAFVPEKAAEVVKIFQTSPDVGWCYHQMSLHHVATGLCTPPPPGFTSRPVDFRNNIRASRLPTFAPATSALCFSRKLLQQILPMPELEGTCADRYLKLAALILSPGYFLDRSLAIQKIHANNAYTLRSDKERTGAKSLVFTATCLRTRFPECIALADKLFAHGLGIYWRTGGIDPQYADIVHNYLANAPLFSRCRTMLRAAYHASTLLAPIRSYRTSRRRRCF